MSRQTGLGIAPKRHCHMATKKTYGRAEKDRFEGDLKLFASLQENRGKSLNISEYQEWAQKHSKTSIDTLRRCYGSWEAATESINASSAKSRTLSDEELLDYYMKCWEWNSEGTFDTNLSPTQNIFNAYNRTTGKKINTYSFIKRGWQWSELKKSMAAVSCGDKSIEEIIALKSATIEDPISPRIRAIVLHRDNRKCRMCGASPLNSSDVLLHVHHIIPRSKGGSSTDLKNLETLCSKCNQGLGDMELN